MTPLIVMMLRATAAAEDQAALGVRPWRAAGPTELPPAAGRARRSAPSSAPADLVDLTDLADLDDPVLPIRGSRPASPVG